MNEFDFERAPERRRNRMSPGVRMVSDFFERKVAFLEAATAALAVRITRLEAVRRDPTLRSSNGIQPS